MSMRSAIRFVPLLLLFLVSGCFYHNEVRHLSSDICLITPNLSQDDVASYLGPPDQRQTVQGEEVWVYVEVKKSTMRKAPYLGKRFGYAEYDVVTITFSNGQVKTCVYRELDERKFKESGLKTGESLEN